MIKITIASVLKPVDDVRAFWKLSQSIAKTNKYDVNIIGNTGKKEVVNKNINFHAHAISRSNWPKRLFVREKILFKILKLRPKVLVITTHELINVALIVKLVTGCRIIYDVQENYFLNIYHINSSYFRKIYAYLVRFKENISRPFISHYWLAEKCYADELPFIKNKSSVIENKALKLEIEPSEFENPKLLFTGTISIYGGIENAIQVFEEFYKINPNTSLKIVGQIHNRPLEERLKQAEKKYKNIELNISFDPVSYEKIIDAIQASNLGIIGYEESPANAKKIPTKLYEYSRYKLPYLVNKNTTWASMGETLGGAIPVDFKELNASLLSKIMENPAYLFPKSYPEDMTWEYEEQKIFTSIKSLIKLH